MYLVMNKYLAICLTKKATPLKGTRHQNHIWIDIIIVLALVNRIQSLYIWNSIAICASEMEECGTSTSLVVLGGTATLPL